MDEKDENQLLLPNAGVSHGTRWKSCCFHIDSGFCRFAVCMLVSVLTLLGALFKLVTDGSCDTYGFWGPILSLIIGIWTPTPKKGSKNQ